MLHRTSLAAMMAAALALTGCASTEGLSDSAISTNLELERIQNNTILLNVMRASLRRPTTYQLLQQVSGSVRPSGNVSLSVPFGVNVATANSLGLTMSGNEGPKITSVPLDTQEFYQGIMAPIKVSTIDFYVQQGYSKGLLYNLFFNRIEIRGNGKSIAFKNYVTEDDEIDRFQMLVDFLLGLGLTTEPTTGSSQYGPIRAKNEVLDLAAVARAAAAGLSITEQKAVEACQDGDETPGCKKAPTYKVTKPSGGPSAKLCFDPSSVPAAKGSELRTCDRFAADETRTLVEVKHLEPLAKELDRVCETKKVVEIKEPGSTNRACTMVADLKDLASDRKKPGQIGIHFVVRSTDGIVYYLGEVARRRLYPDRGSRRVVAYRREPILPRTSPIQACQLDQNGMPVNAALGPDNSQNLVPQAGGRNDDECYPIFWVDQNTPSPVEVAAVEYEGARFSVPGRRPTSDATPTPGERSSQVIGIVAQLVALNKAAKDQPGTSVLNVINP